MFKTDYKPNRLKCCLYALKTLIKERSEVDGSSSFAIVKFSDKAQKVLDFTNYVEELYDALDLITIGGRSNLGDGLAKSIKMIVAELRKIAAKIPKILLVSDGKYTSSAIDPLKMARLAQGLNIKIDTLRLGEASNLNILKRLSDLTNGRYFYNNDAETLINSCQEFARSNIKRHDINLDSMTKNLTFIRRIAAPLLRVQDSTKDQKIRRKQIMGEVDFKKCSICFSETEPTTQGSFFLTGRYCPNCQAPFHIHCLSLWSESQKDDSLSKSGTCRCPHCFYLLKIPAEVTQTHKLHQYSKLQSRQQTLSKQPETFNVYIANSSDLGDEAMYNSCSMCNFIFEENQDVVRCGNPECEVLYHFDCFQKLTNSQCKNCGAKLKVQ